MCDYGDYIAEEEEKINAIIDEQAVYDIASKKVKEEIDKLKSDLKWYKDDAKRLKDNLRDLRQSNDELQAKIVQLQEEKDNLVVTLTDEQFREELRQRNPWHLAEGDTCYYCKYTTIRTKTCPVCNGLKKITLNKENFSCPKCRGEGEIYTFGYTVRECTVEYIGWLHYENYSRGYVIKFTNGDSETLFKNEVEYTFKDKKEAEAKCAELNKKERGLN